MFRIVSEYALSVSDRYAGIRLVRWLPACSLSKQVQTLPRGAETRTQGLKL